jgi:hypothetical protein
LIYTTSSTIQPVVAFILARIFFNELFIWNDGVGMVLVIIGLVLVTWARARESNDDKKPINSDNNINDNAITANNTERSPLLSVNLQK